MTSKTYMRKTSVKQPQKASGNNVFRHLGSTGKELDLETGYSYFGARYLDNTLSTAWLSVDPMSDKYPCLSPYAYCAWNPIRVIDPNGDSLRLDGTDEQRQRALNFLHQYSRLTYLCDNNGYVTLDTETTPVMSILDRYISEMISDNVNISVIKLTEKNDKINNLMKRGIFSLFGGNEVDRDCDGNIVRVEGTQYLYLDLMEIICHNSMTCVAGAEKYPGLIILHEFSEGYEGCKLARKYNRPLEMEYEDYHMAHSNANRLLHADFVRVDYKSENIKIKLSPPLEKMPRLNYFEYQ